MMNKVRIKQTGIITLLIGVIAVLITGCSQMETSLFEENALLRFRCDSVTTRASGLEQSGSNAITSIGVYAAHTEADWTGTSPLNFMQNRKVERTDAASPWSYSPEAYWPGGGKTSFFAYAPHDAPGLAVNATNGGVPQMEFTVADAHAQQVDLLTATALKNQTVNTSTGGYASFMLRHALTRISFAAKTSMVTTEDVRVTAITIRNLHNQGTSLMDAGNRQWTPSAAASASYTLSSAEGGGLKTDRLTADYETVTTADGNLFLLPQTLPAAAELVVTYTNNGVEGTVVIKLADVLAQWQPGEALRFLINLVVTDPANPFEVKLIYEFVPWDKHSTDVEINQDPFLYVTDVVTSSYDAAITRVYFYTNEPLSEVFIDPIGRVASLTGATVHVKDEFHALVANDPDGKANFHFDEATHQGWIDLINRNTTTAGIKQPLILKICAGKLDRYITVQPVVTVEAASQKETRYIGTFHRRNEMGERIITWHVGSDVSWEATIDLTVGNHSDLVIDRMASPDFKDNLLYSLVPRTAEGAKVEPNASVSGKGRVYFRVGWKNTSPTTNRYARITVEYTGTGAPATPDYIYCRQGEEPDILAQTSQATHNFTVYNLAGDGVFVDYPTQGGFISQWGRPRLWPLIGDDTPAGYPLVENTEDLDPDVNICPERYTYLNKTAIAELTGALGYLKPRWGYYADGFFDRRGITEHRVDDSSINVASAGILLSLEGNAHSVFVPTVGYRDETGKLLGKGIIGGYWTGYQEEAVKRNAMAVKVSSGADLDIKGYDKRNSFFLRCVEIPDAVVLYFNANGGDNAPRPVSTSKHTDARIPSKSPSDYWKDNYAFDGWNTQKDGGGTTHAPGSNFSMGATDQILYAKWVPDLYRVNFRSYMNETEQDTYLLPTTGSLTSYNGYVIGANGTKLTSSLYYGWPSVADVATQEKAYGNLEFHKELQTKASWTDAYQYCKSLDEGTQGWRLPRAVELLLIANHSSVDIKNAIFGGASILWSGTEYSKNADQAYYVLPSIMAQPNNKTENQLYRCVRELK